MDIAIIQKRINRAIQNFKVGVYAKISSVIKGNNEVFVKISEEEELRDIKITSPYGIYSLPVNGMFGQVVFNNSGKKASLVGVEDRDAKPVQLDIGEVLVYNKKTKTYIHLKNDGKIYLKGETRIDGDLYVKGVKINV